MRFRRPVLHIPRIPKQVPGGFPGLDPNPAFVYCKTRSGTFGRVASTEAFHTYPRGGFLVRTAYHHSARKGATV
ncbi:hypothetical protein CLAIMM_01891 [Cladophialophora immunda]|nr:hypothetical protein CLAIMM_01891 [Cladophialophora immunda]